MRKRTILVMIVMAFLPLISSARQNSFQHISIKLNNGDSIQYCLGPNYASEIQPKIKDGKTVWSFIGNVKTNNFDVGEYNDISLRWEIKEAFSIEDVEKIDFRSREYDSIEARKALIELYQIMGGDNWWNNTNWCSDKPINEWYGLVNGWYNTPSFVSEMYLSMLYNNTDFNGVPIPECIQRIGPISNLEMAFDRLKGSIPEWLCNMYSLKTIDFSGNELSGTIPDNIGIIPYLTNFSIYENQFEGPLPEKAIVGLMDNPNIKTINFNHNNFSGKIPDGIRNHPKFSLFWPTLIYQRENGIDFSDLIIPAPTFVTLDFNGDTIDMKKIYNKNRYTLIYRWDHTRYSENVKFLDNLVIINKALKDKDFEIIGLEGGYHYLPTKEDHEELSKIMEEHNITWRNILFQNFDWFLDGMVLNRISRFDPTDGSFFQLVDQDGNVVITDFANEDWYWADNETRKALEDKLYVFLNKELGIEDSLFACLIEDELYTSTDYSHDGDVTKLQSATIGNGVDLVFIGEGFVDKDLEDGGAFDKQMQKALEQFFAYEPYTSLRDRFNVYAVKTVSPNAAYMPDCVHAIDEDISKVFEYANKVEDLIPGRPKRANVIYKDNSGGRSYTVMFDDDSYVSFSMDGVSSVLNHEAGGHGIGKLLDEYVEMLVPISDGGKIYLDSIWMTSHIGANVDWRSDPSDVKWAKFINDSRYSDENIGVFQGGYLYEYGVYRPTENSMMRYHITPFNAPSREEIYKRVMRESEGEDWTYDYETFVQFDAAGHSQFVNSLKNAPVRTPLRQDGQIEEQPIIQRTAPPIIIEGTWRDVLK